MARKRYERDYEDDLDSYAKSRRSRYRDYDDGIAEVYSRPEYDEDYTDVESDYEDTDYGYDDTDSGYDEYSNSEYSNYDDTESGYSNDDEYLGYDDESDEDYENRPSRRTLPTERSYTRIPPASNRFQTQDDKDIEKYLDYLERYDTGEIDNYEMSRIQRAYAKKPFWRTFQPSRDLIKKYGSGNQSTRWPMFRREGSRWVPEVWRND